VLDSFKLMGALAGLMRNKDKLEASALRVKEAMETTTAEGESGGGAVRTVVSAQMKVESVTLDPALAAGLAMGGASQEMAEALIAEAVNDGIAKAKKAAQTIVEAELQELGLGDLEELKSLPGVGGLLP
jgi:DNA-binding protein YbaB